MKFGLIAQMQAPKPWPPGENVDHRIHWDTLAEAMLAEDVGFDYYWATEHHFYEEIAHSSAPEIFLAALAARTTRIRLGHGVVVLPCNHPVRVAERGDRVVFLDEGRIVEEGSPKEVLDNPREERTKQFLRRTLTLDHALEELTIDEGGEVV